MRKDYKDQLHWLVATTITAISLAMIWGLLVQIGKALQGTAGPTTPLIPYNEVSRFAMETRLDHLKALSGLAIGALAGLWGLLILRPDETRWIIGNAQQRLMLASAMLLLVASAGVASFYQWMLTEALFQCAQQRSTGLSIFSASSGPLMTIWLGVQFLLVLGVMVAGATVTSAHVLAPPGSTPTSPGPTVTTPPPPTPTPPTPSGAAPQSRRKKRH